MAPRIQVDVTDHGCLVEATKTDYVTADNAKHVELTDATIGLRAGCVMLNKGPYVVSAVRVLDDILRRMQAHQAKKRSMLRKLHLAHARPLSTE